MTQPTLPRAPEGRPCAAVSSYLSPRALERWDSAIRASVSSDDRSISVYDVIGYDWWTGEGVTAKRVAAALRQMGAGPVTVHINSPGGDMFEGLAIYNLLREHQGEVTVKVLGVAASAASIVAMAGDNVEVARSSFFMVHNCWLVASGNRHDLREIADWMEPFDQAMIDIYVARTGLDMVEVQKQLDAESWINGSSAIEQGYADKLLESDQISKAEGKASASAVRRVEAAIRAAGLPRSESHRLIHDFKTSLSDSVGSGRRNVSEHGQSESAVAKQYLNILSTFEI